MTNRASTRLGFPTARVGSETAQPLLEDSTASAKPLGSHPHFGRNTIDDQQLLTYKLYNPQDDAFKYTVKVLILTTEPSHDGHQAQRSLQQALYGEEVPEQAGTSELQACLP